MSEELLGAISRNVVQGRVKREDEGLVEKMKGTPAIRELIQEAIDKQVDFGRIMSSMNDAMKIVGDKFEKEIYFIPDMLRAANTVGEAMKILEPHLVKAGVKSGPKFLLATVLGDQHDIGKNIVGMMLKGAGFNLIDLGVNVSPGKVLSVIEQEGIEVIGLSALLTTTMPNMEKTIEEIRKAGMRDQVRILIGGAPTTPKFAEDIGADGHGRDGFQAVELARKLSART
jgi:5-methyltetrahydrofolate--homocysteine methyltransferase